MAEELKKIEEEMEELAKELAGEEEPKKEEEPKADEPKKEEPKTETEPGPVKKFFNTVTAPARWCWGKIEENPGSAAVGGAIGVGGTILVPKLVRFVAKKIRNQGFEAEEFVDDEPDSDDDQGDDFVPFDKEDSM